VIIGTLQKIGYKVEEELFITTIFSAKKQQTAVLLLETF